MTFSVVNSIKKKWSKSSNKGIIYNRFGFQSIDTTFFTQYTELLYKLFRGTAVLEGQWKVAFGEISYASMYQIVTEGKFKIFDRKLSNSSKFYYLEPGPYPSFTDNVEAMNTLVQERYKLSESCITVKVSRWTQRFQNYFAIERSCLAFFSTNLGRFFGSNLVYEFKVILRGWFSLTLTLTNLNLLRTLSACYVLWNIQTWLGTIFRQHRSSITKLFSFYFKGRSLEHYNHWKLHDQPDI